MHLAGWALSRLISGSALAGLFVLALSQLPEFPPPVVAEAPPLEKTDKLAPVAVAIPKPFGKPVRTIPIYMPTEKSPPLPAVIGPSPFAVPPPPVAPIAAPIAPPPPAPVEAEVAPTRAKVAPAPKPERHRAEKPKDRFSRFCRGRGPRSWMRFNGKKRYCK